MPSVRRRRPALPVRACWPPLPPGRSGWTRACPASLLAVFCRRWCARRVPDVPWRAPGALPGVRSAGPVVGPHAGGTARSVVVGPPLRGPQVAVVGDLGAAVVRGRRTPRGDTGTATATATGRGGRGRRCRGGGGRRWWSGAGELGRVLREV